MKEYKSYKIMECDTVIGRSKEEVIKWYDKHICELDSDDIESIEEEKLTTGMWFPSDSEIEFKKDEVKRSLGDCKEFEGVMYEWVTIQDAFDRYTKYGKEYKEPFVIASVEV